MQNSKTLPYSRYQVRVITRQAVQPRSGWRSHPQHESKRLPGTNYHDRILHPPSNSLASRATSVGVFLSAFSTTYNPVLTSNKHDRVIFDTFVASSCLFPQSFFDTRGSSYVLVQPRNASTPPFQKRSALRSRRPSSPASMGRFYYYSHMSTGH